MLDKLFRWYKARYWDDKDAKFPKCPFCGRQEFVIVRPPTLVNSRLHAAPKVRVAVQCLNCGSRMTASRFLGSLKWSYFEAM